MTDLVVLAYSVLISTSCLSCSDQNAKSSTFQTLRQSSSRYDSGSAKKTPEKPAFRPEGSGREAEAAKVAVVVFF